MKVLFAVNNDNVSEAIVKKYQKEYKEILSYKNVYYFNAILRELQKDKSYSRIVISEDLEPFANNNYSSIDKFLFEKYSAISEVAKNINNESIDIILICADRRKKTDDILVKVYKAGIYNAIIGQDRSIDEVCRLINRPRSKDYAKGYYNIQESELGGDDAENSVSEAEVQNILAHYKRLGRNEDKYVESFNNIVSQYTDAQLRIIIKYLPINVKAVLEERSQKYQQLAMSYGNTQINVKRKTIDYKNKIKEEEDAEEEDEIQQLKKTTKVSNVVVPTNLTTQNVQKVVIPNIVKPEIKKEMIIEPEIVVPDNSKEIKESENNNMEKSEVQENITTAENVLQEPVVQKKGRGRPRKNPLPVVEEVKPKRGRGRPKKQELEETKQDNNIIEEADLFNIDNNEEQQEEVDLFNLDQTERVQNDEVDLFSIEEINTEQSNQETIENKEVDLFNIDDSSEPEIDLFNLEDNNEQKAELFNEEQKNEPEIDLFNIDESKTESNQGKILNPVVDTNYEIRNEQNVDQSNYITNTNISEDINLKTLLTGDKKVVAFVGTTKNGTSFIVNNTAEMLASMGIETAILDLTKTKNAYYIYTNNEESLRTIAKNCMQGLQNGIAEGIKVRKNLTVYTEMPGEEKEYSIATILSTLVKNHSAILIDTDFDTPDDVFANVQEIYLVQTMDVLTIQPLTAFLRNLKSRNVLAPEKLKIVINKSTRVRSLNVKTLIGGMSCYNSPSMTYMTELFNKDNIRYCEIPFEEQNYVKYLDSLVNCSISLNGYTKQFINSLRELANIVYPLVNKQNYSPMNKKSQKDPFSSHVNDTLNKMKSKY